MKIDQDWDPELYLKFRDERTQPSIDLINRIDAHFRPRSILDVGCGPGNSSQALLTRWPQAMLTGLDNSPSMIDRARATFPESNWVCADASDYAFESRYDLVFSNATIQWIPDHPHLFQHLFSLLNAGGVLVISTPRFDVMPLSDVIHEVASRRNWRGYTGECRKLFTYHDQNYYYDLLVPFCRRIEMWQTDYIHILESQSAIVEWIRSTGLKPYLESLPAGQQPGFEREVLAALRNVYPLQKDGKVLFPFKRLFMIGYGTG